MPRSVPDWERAHVLWQQRRDIMEAQCAVETGTFDEEEHPSEGERVLDFSHVDGRRSALSLWRPGIVTTAAPGACFPGCLLV
jgi:hypothetical protein